MKFKVIPGKLKEEEMSLEEVYHRALDRFCSIHGRADISNNLEVKMKYLHLQIQYLSLPEYKSNSQELHRRFQNFCSVTDILATLTPRIILCYFPLTKCYKGAKYQEKDYFSSMKKIDQIGLDNVIGDQIEDFLWDYVNKDLKEFEVKKLISLSNLRRAEGYKGLAEAFAEKEGITTYTLNKEKQYLINNRTGQVHKIVKGKRRIPEYLRILN